MKFDKFTLKAQEALATAQQTVMAKSHTIMSPLHLLSAVCDDDSGIAIEILKKIGSNISRIREMIASEVDRLPQGKSTEQVMPDPALGQVVLDAQNRADAMGDEYLSVEHLFISLASVQSDAKEILRLNSISPEQIESALKRWNATGSICWRWRARESSTLSSAGTKRFGGACRFSTAGERTIPY